MVPTASEDVWLRARSAGMGVQQSLEQSVGLSLAGSAFHEQTDKDQRTSEPIPSRMRHLLRRTHRPRGPNASRASVVTPSDPRKGSEFETQERGQNLKSERAPGPFSHRPTATAQTRRERFLNPRPSQRSGLSGTSGASDGSGVLVVVGVASALLMPFLVTLMAFVIALLRPLLETSSV